MTEEEKNILSQVGINQIFEGTGNIINIVGKIIDEGAISKEINIKHEKTPVCSHNSQ